jgi:hypothetical protein
MADGNQGDIDDALREAPLVHEFARQHEERDGHQRKAVGAIDDVLRHDLGIEHPDRAHQCDTADDQGKGDRHAQRHGAEQREGKDRDGHILRSRDPERVGPGWMLGRMPADINAPPIP